MFILLQKPEMLYNKATMSWKSINYFKLRINYGFSDPSELICLPTVAVFLGLFSFILANMLVE